MIASLLNEMTLGEPHETFIALSHTKELVLQGAKTYAKFYRKQPAIYSASLGQKQVGPVTFAQIQSISRARHKLRRVRCLVIDECDRIPPEGDGQYLSLIKELRIVNPDLYIVGCTATPYRMGSGLVYGEGRLFDSLCYDAKVTSLISDGYLSKLVGKEFRGTCVDNVKKSNGDYEQGALDAVLSEDVETIRGSVAEILSHRNSRRGALIFVGGTKHGLMVQEEFKRQGVELPFVTGETESDVRDSTVAKFSSGELWGLININVYTVGFDVPHVDLVAMLRPTKSPGLYYQTCGRGFRTCDGKKDCLVLDFAGNIHEHGPIDTLNDRIKAKKKRKGPADMPQKLCEACGEPNAIGALVCCKCGAAFPEREIVKHATEATNAQPLSVPLHTPISNMRAFVNPGKDGKPDTVRIDFFNGYVRVASKWLAVDQHSNQYARRASLLWLANARKSEPLFTIVSGTIYGHTTEGAVAIWTAKDMVPYCSCLVVPTSIETLPSSNNPKYVDIINMHYESCSTTTST